MTFYPLSEPDYDRQHEDPHEFDEHFDGSYEDDASEREGFDE